MLTDEDIARVAAGLPRYRTAENKSQRWGEVLDALDQAVPREVNEILRGISCADAERIGSAVLRAVYRADENREDEE